jgi:Lrp/AsnC family transcriptional regulator for asnA, asnC and gidA
MTETDFRDAVSSRIASDDGTILDDTDYQIMALLRKDGRMPYRALAKEVGITESRVRARVRRLEDSDTMRVVAVTDFEAAGFAMMLAVGIQVEGRPADEVALELARFPEVFSVCQVVGTLDIEILVVARDQEMLNDMLSEKLAKVAGVSRLFPALAMDVLKNQPNWVPFDQSGTRHPAVSGGVGGKRQLDELDLSILEWLSEDARTSNRKIATELGVTEGTVRARIKRMEDDGQIRITAINNINRLANPTLAYLWVEVDKSSQAQAVAQQLSAIPEIGFVGGMLGRADILAITMVQNNAQLADFLHTTISVIPGIRRTECSLGVNFVKHDYRICRIV